MKGDKIPDEDHISRLCFPKHVDKTYGEIQATAFMLREGEESLSVNWLEILKLQNRDCELSEIKSIYKSKFSVNPNAKIAILNIGEVCDIVNKESEDNRILEILHDPGKNDPSHSGIYNLNHDDQLIAELILKVVSEIHPAS